MGSEEQDELPLIFIHRLPQFNLPPIFTSRLQTLFRLIDPASQSHSHSEESLSVVRALLCLDPAPLHSQTLDLLPSLQCVVATSSGVDHIDLAECRRRRIAVANAGPAFAADVAEYAVALLIDVLRRLSASHRYVRAGLWPLNGDYSLGSKTASAYIIRECQIFDQFAVNFLLVKVKRFGLERGSELVLFRDGRDRRR